MSWREGEGGRWRRRGEDAEAPLLVMEAVSIIRSDKMNPRDR